LLRPKPPETAGEAQGRLRVAIDRPGQGGTKIVVLGLQAIEPWLRHRLPRISMFRQAQTVGGVATAGFWLFPGFL
jgi:hypothetical protein